MARTEIGGKGQAKFSKFQKKTLCPG